MFFFFYIIYKVIYALTPVDSYCAESVLGDLAIMGNRLCA